LHQHFFFFFFFFFLQYWGLINSGSTPWTTPPGSPLPFFLSWVFFEVGSHKLISRLVLKLDPPDLCLLSS
jgi:hypothetical protein